MADSRNSSAPFNQVTSNIAAGQFDDSIFDTFAVRPADSPGSLADPTRTRTSIPRSRRRSARDCRPASACGTTRTTSTNSSRGTAPAASVVLQAPDAGERSARTQAPEPTSTVPLHRACAEIGGNLDAIGAALRLFPDSPRPTTERVALDLIHAEVSRAAWYLQALSILEQDVPVSNVPVDLEAIVNRAARGLAPGWERHGSRIAVVARAGRTRRAAETSDCSPLPLPG